MSRSTAARRSGDIDPISLNARSHAFGHAVRWADGEDLASVAELSDPSSF
jgi:hypothetical protein